MVRNVNRTIDIEPLFIGANPCPEGPCNPRRVLLLVLLLLLREFPQFAGIHPPFTEKAATASKSPHTFAPVNNAIAFEENGMRSRSLQSRPSDTIIGIVIATIGTLALLARLNVFTMSFNLPGDLVTWWPMLLVSWGVVLLFLPERARR